MNNFDRIRIDYYRDQTVALEAFKANAYDYRPETSSKDWATGYRFPAVDAGLVRAEKVPHSRPTGMQAFAFNLRRAKFKDIRVREAIGLAFDFNWSNRNLFYGQYSRTASFLLQFRTRRRRAARTGGESAAGSRSAARFPKRRSPGRSRLPKPTGRAT